MVLALEASENVWDAMSCVVVDLLVDLLLDGRAVGVNVTPTKAWPATEEKDAGGSSKLVLVEISEELSSGISELVVAAVVVVVVVVVILGRRVVGVSVTPTFATPDSAL